jgi:hypothetical protein
MATAGKAICSSERPVRQFRSRLWFANVDSLAATGTDAIVEAKVLGSAAAARPSNRAGGA